MKRKGKKKDEGGGREGRGRGREGRKRGVKEGKTLPFPHLQQNHSHSLKYCYGQVVSGKYQR